MAIFNTELFVYQRVYRDVHEVHWDLSGIYRDFSGISWDISGMVAGI